MTLKIRQRCYPIETASSGFEETDFLRTVWWLREDGESYLNTIPVPDGYYPGLLTCYIDEEKVDLQTFDRALERLNSNLTRDDIKKALS